MDEFYESINTMEEALQLSTDLRKVLGARLASFIRQQQRFSLNHTYLWIDSSTVLQWIHGSDKR